MVVTSSGSVGSIAATASASGGGGSSPSNNSPPPELSGGGLTAVMIVVSLLATVALLVIFLTWWHFLGGKRWFNARWLNLWTRWEVRFVNDNDTAKYRYDRKRNRYDIINAASWQPMEVRSDFHDMVAGDLVKQNFDNLLFDGKYVEFPVLDYQNFTGRRDFIR